MKEKNYWDQFCKSGKVEDYLRFKEEKNKQKETVGEMSHARAGSSDRDHFKSSACGRV